MVQLMNVPIGVDAKFWMQVVTVFMVLFVNGGLLIKTWTTFRLKHEDNEKEHELIKKDILCIKSDLEEMRLESRRDDNELRKELSALIKEMSIDNKTDHYSITETQKRMADKQEDMLIQITKIATKLDVNSDKVIRKTERSK